MYSKLPLKFIGITENFGMRKDPITGVSTYHYGTDFGWNKYQGEPVYAANTGKIVYEGYDANLGNYVVLKYTSGNNTIINRYLHLKNRALVRVNQTVKRGQILGYMGATGYVTGVHLHFEYWICPKSYIYKYSDRSKYARNPLNYCYLFDDQKVSNSSSLLVKRVVGTPVSRNTKRSQIKVIGKNLNCRDLPSLNGKILGYIDFGYYNVLDSRSSDGYTWYKIAANKWIANVKGAITTYIISQNNIKTQEEANQINNENILTTEKEEIKDAITEIETIETSKNEELKSFESPKDDYYYIYLKKGEKIYYPTK